MLHFKRLVETITQFVDYVKARLMSQLIKGISSVLLKLLKYFNGTIIPKFLFHPL